MSGSFSAAVVFRPHLLVLLPALLAALSGGSARGANRFESTCETIPSEIHITKDEYDKNSVMVRSCEENIAINKCEGACASSIKPSALNSLGFQKDCQCCRESSYRKRTITLSNCFDSDGARLVGALGSMVVTVNEPMDCKCHECGKRP